MPRRVPDSSGLIHRLLVKDRFNEHRPRESLEIIHDPNCPYETYDDHVEWTCHEGVQEQMDGLDLFFRHRDDPDTDWGRELRLEPGLYEIRAWTEKYDRPGDPVEYDGGIEVLEECRGLQLDPHEQLPPPESHQVWAWMGGAPIPHYRICGTGLILDPETEQELRERRLKLRLEAEQERTDDA